MRTLPDYLSPGLDLVFVGINPGLYSVERGHYFARPANRFWRAFSGSVLSAPIRASLGRAELGPEDDAGLLAFGIGFTDVVKVPSRSAGELRTRHYRLWAPRLLARLETCAPRVACFHGLTAFRAFGRHALGKPEGNRRLGLQPHRVGLTHLFVIPNPSPANARFHLRDYVAWYNRLAAFLHSLSASSPTVPPV